MAIKLILARARNGVIGLNNKLPWHLPEDLAHFKKTTMGSPVLMGKNTWESIPSQFRPLPGRMNFVLSRTLNLCSEHAHSVQSLQEALALVSPEQDLWVIGGAQVYAQCMAIAKHAVITQIEADFEGDAYAPIFDTRWREVNRSEHTGANGLVYSLVYLDNTQGV